ncbi:MAG: protein kinase domain-containing protein, partial [Gemmatimonadaceae bacterium]
MIDAPAARVASALADRYRIERELGQGGMATVYLAEDLKHHRRVAIKVLKPELAAVLGAERFVQEIATTAALQHPNVLPLFDSGTADGFLYYVMPYVDGETLRAKLDRETQLGVDESVKLVGEIADALQYAHDHGVVHRDIKPENILLHAGRPMVADFGIALAVSAAAGGRMTETGLSLGTPHYMSPEQATAEKTITNRSDIYSLAAVLYEMLAGEPPHMGNSAQAIIMKIVTDDAHPIGELRKSVPAYVAAAIAKALQRVPADRFESARGFSSALNDPSFASSAEGASRRLAATPLRGARRWKPIAGIAAALIVVGAAGAWVGSRRSTVEPTVATVSINLAPSDDLSAARPIDRRANADPPPTDALAFAPDGRTLMFAGWRSGHRLLLRRSIATGETTPIAGTDGAEAPFFSPDGHTVGFWANGWLQRVPLDGGTPVQIAPVTRPAGASWGDDGRIVYSELHAALRRVAASGGTPEQLQTPVGAHLPWVLLGPKAVLYTVAYGFDFAQRRIEVLDLKTGIRTTVLDNA